MVHGGVQLGQIFLSQILVTYRPVRCQAVCNASIFFVFCFVFHFLCACALYEGGLVNISFFVFFLLLFVKISYVFAGSACVRIRPPRVRARGDWLRNAARQRNLHVSAQK